MIYIYMIYIYIYIILPSWEGIIFTCNWKCMFFNIKDYLNNSISSKYAFLTKPDKCPHIISFLDEIWFDSVYSPFW